MIDPFSKLLWPIFYSIVIVLLSMFQRAHAFVPKAKTIIEKTAHNHGKGFYAIQLEVSFRNENGNQTVTENWLVENGESMSVEARGPGFQYTAVYRGKQKFYMDETGAEKSARLSPEFFEDIFHLRGAESLGGEFIGMNIIPARALNKETRIKTLKDVKHEHENYVRLSRTAGVVNYALGKPTPAESTTLLPGVWIEQDRFHIRRVRFPTQAELFADDYTEYGRNFFYPKTRTVSWLSKSVSVRTVKVAAINPSNDQKARLSPSFLRTRKQNQLQYTASEGELTPLIREFYQKFR
jgi:hypothetical protein